MKIEVVYRPVTPLLPFPSNYGPTDLPPVSVIHIPSLTHEIKKWNKDRMRTQGVKYIQSHKYEQRNIGETIICTGNFSLSSQPLPPRLFSPSSHIRPPSTPAQLIPAKQITPITQAHRRLGIVVVEHQAQTVIREHALPAGPIRRAMALEEHAAAAGPTVSARLVNLSTFRH